MKALRMLQFTLPIAVGFAGGFAILHPASILIVDLFEQSTFSVSHVLLGAFGGIHIPMGIFFSILGGIIGLLFSLHSDHLRRTNEELVRILNDIERRNASLIKRTEQKSPDLSSIVKEMRPTLNKIQKLVALITEGSAGSVTMRQSTLLSLTRGNIDNLFYVIDYLLTMLERDSAAEPRTSAGMEELPEKNLITK